MREPAMYRGKRGLDVILGAAALTVFSPVMAITAVAVRVDLGSPVLFRQIRAGREGRRFTLLKFRTMRDAMPGEGLEADGKRLSSLGQRLRSTSLDELPQLVNILRGDMSLVGPRPLPDMYVERYSPRQRRRLEVPPGLTGWAQVNGRNTLDWNERFELDVWYVDNASLALDLRILALTVKRVVTRQGISADGEATMPEFLGG